MSHGSRGNIIDGQTDGQTNRQTDIHKRFFSRKKALKTPLNCRAKLLVAREGADTVVYGIKSSSILA